MPIRTEPQVVQSKPRENRKYIIFFLFRRHEKVPTNTEQRPKENKQRNPNNKSKEKIGTYKHFVSLIVYITFTFTILINLKRNNLFLKFIYIFYHARQVYIKKSLKMP